MVVVVVVSDVGAGGSFNEWLTFGLPLYHPIPTMPEHLRQKQRLLLKAWDSDLMGNDMIGTEPPQQPRFALQSCQSSDDKGVHVTDDASVCSCGTLAAAAAAAGSFDSGGSDDPERLLDVDQLLTEALARGGTDAGGSGASGRRCIIPPSFFRCSARLLALLSLSLPSSRTVLLYIYNISVCLRW